MTLNRHRVPIAKQMNDYVASYEIPYIVSTTWREVGH